MMQTDTLELEEHQEASSSFRDFFSESNFDPNELESKIEDKVRAKTIELLASLGKQDLVPDVDSRELSQLLPQGFTKLSAQEQDKKIRDCLVKTSYGKTLQEFKAFVIEKLNDPLIQTTKQTVKDVAGKVVEMAQQEDTHLFKLYFSALNFCQVAAEQKGFFGSLCEPIVQLSDALTKEGSKFNLSVFLSNWEGDAAKLAVKEIGEEDQVVEKTVLQATSMVFKEENDFLNQSIMDLNQTLNETMEQSRIYQRDGDTVSLKNPANERSLSGTFIANLKIVKTQEAKAKKVAEGNRELLDQPVQERLKQYMSEKALCYVSLLSELFAKSEQLIVLLESQLTPINGLQDRSNRASAGFFPQPSQPENSQERKFLNAEIKRYGILRKLIYQLATNNQTNKTDQFILAYLKQLNQGGDTYALLAQQLKSIQQLGANLSDEMPNFKVEEKWGFLENCYKVGLEYGCILPKDLECGALMKTAKLKKLAAAPKLPSSSNSEKPSSQEEHRTSGPGMNKTSS